MVNGRIWPTQGVRAGKNPGGVGCQTPGPLPGVYGTLASRPSPERAASSALADSSPVATPASLDLELAAIFAKEAANCVSRADCCVGKYATSTRCAAAIAAASSEAPSGAVP